MKIRKQRGLTLIGFAIVLILAVFFAYSAMRIVPVYLEYHAVVQAMDNLKNDPMAKTLSPDRIKRRLEDSIWVSVTVSNVDRKHMRISRGDGVKVRIAYDVRKPYIGNIDLIISFDRTVTLR